MISCRRLLYHQVILKRENKELTKRVYLAQTEIKTPEDFELINEVQDDRLIQTANRFSYKQNIKARIKVAALK